MRWRERWILCHFFSPPAFGSPLVRGGRKLGCVYSEEERYQKQIEKDKEKFKNR